MIFPQLQATPEQIIIEPLFFSILFGKIILAVTYDLCLEYFGVVYLLFIIIFACRPLYYLEPNRLIH